jgi:hypothetical protein
VISLLALAGGRANPLLSSAIMRLREWQAQGTPREADPITEPE